MSYPTTFDPYAHDYDATVQAAIGASGESVAYFAQLKAQLVKEQAGPSPRVVLDFGCGIGNTTRALATVLPDASVVGADTSVESIATARARTRANINFVPITGTRLPFADQAFDVVSAACVFHHIAAPDQPRWLGEIARVLRPGGRCMLFEHNPLNPLTRRVVRNIPFDRGVVLLGRRRSAQLLRGAGLRVRQARYYFFFPRFLAPLRALEPLLGWVPFGAQYLVVGERSGE